MNIIVLVKQVPDTETKIKVTSDKKGIEQNDIKWVINPYDEFAIEQALKTKEQLKTGSVTVISMGPDRVVDALRTALAMGADNACHIKGEGPWDTALVAHALSEAIKKESGQIVFTGKQAIDDDQASTFSYLAELLDWPSVSVVVACEVTADKAVLQREVEGGIRFKMESPLPCVIAVDKGINTPRYASLPGIMKAKKKEIKTYSLADLGLTSEQPKTTTSDYALPPERQAGKKIDGDAAAQAQELARLLREEAKVI